MTDEQLIEGILKNDETSFKTLVDKYQASVLNICYGFVRNAQNAEDITQEVFIEVYLSAGKFRKESKISTWLYRIAVNKSLNFIRDNKKRNLIKNIENFFLSEQKNEIQIADENENNFEEDYETRLKILYKAIDSLSENQKTAFTLGKIEKLSYAEISEIMNISLASVEGLIHRAKKNIQKKILKNYQKNKDKNRKF